MTFISKNTLHKERIESIMYAGLRLIEVLTDKIDILGIFLSTHGHFMDLVRFLWLTWLGWCRSTPLVYHTHHRFYNDMVVFLVVDGF